MTYPDPGQYGSRGDHGAQVYARLTPRLQALVRDLIAQLTILVCLIVPTSIVSNRTFLRTLAPVCLLAFFLYEPVLVALRGATIGHRSLNLRIVRARDLGRVSFPRALLRTLVKAIFGLPAFVAVYLTARHQALHDLAAGTVVIPHDPRIAQPGWFDPARPDEPDSVMPGAVRRIAVIVAHWIALVVLYVLALAALFPEACIDDARGCSPIVRLIDAVFGLLFVMGLVVLGITGWQGALWGAQRKSAAPRVAPPSAPAHTTGETGGR